MTRNDLRIACFILALVAWGARAVAHPLGLSSINRYVGVQMHAREIEVDYLLDLAEIPAWTEIESLDTNHDSAVTPPERDRYLDGLVARLRPHLELRAGGAPCELREVFRTMEAPPGQNGLSTLRIAVEFRAALPATCGPRCEVAVRDTFYANRGGWREIGAQGTAAATVVASSLPPGPRAGATLVYPTDPDDRTTVRVSPPRQDSATFTFERRVATPVSTSGRAAGTVGGRRDAPSDGARLVALLREPHRSWSFVLFALALAFALGAGHALSPGHGKALVAAWLIGARGRPRDAVTLGVTVTVTHTASVFALGLLALSIERFVGSDKVLRTLELVSGTLVAGLALSQLPGRIRRARGAPHDHPHDHDHDHAHDHDHGHDHEGGHSHAPPEKLTLRGLLALGVSGGLVPCPGALVVLLAAIGLRQLGFGMALLVAFSMGLATVLSLVGLVFVLARRRFERFSTEGRLWRVLPVLSSVAVLALGVAIIARSAVR